MPLYEYECEACGGRFEQIRKFSDPPLEECALCGKGPVRRLLSSPAIQFKGSGWYITDYAQKGKSGRTDASSPDGKAGGETKSDAAKPADTGAKSSEPASKPGSSTTTKPD